MGTRRPGDIIGRRYRILDTLGQGGMGTVHLAKDRLDGLVALKRLAVAADDVSDHGPPPISSLDPDAPTSEWPSHSRPGPVSADAPTQVSSAPVVPSASPGSLTSTTLHADAATRAASPARGLRSPGGDASASSGGLALVTLAAPALSPDQAPTSSVLVRAEGSPADDLAEILRLTLAREFHLLASLRHPNIISVLDYGFDDDLSPYFTMELLEGAESIMTAAAGRPLEDRIDLLAQALHALAYLHRRGVIHRDLKPGNVMVVGGRVKVLDFGVSTLRDRRAERGGLIVGTLAYMAPEMLRGKQATEASDLYAVGTIAYELFAGRHPFDLGDVYRLREEILRRPPDLSPLDPRLRPVVGRLLEKRPDARYGGVDELFVDLAARTGRPIQVETATTRESFLQAAELVGRDVELAEVSAMLAAAVAGQGGGVLVGGESGVGKSRLLDELRARALVEGVVVLRGQAAAPGSAGGGPYHVFREVLRGLSLRADLDDFEAGVLAAVVPDLSALLERDVPERAEIDPEAAHQRLLSVVERLFARQRAPLLVILEDLHWVGSESLRLLSHLAGLSASQPVLLVGSYRDDERPDLPRDLPLLRVLKLGRLSGEGIAALAASMLGEAGRRPEVIDRLRRETEGNPFFLVEVVRALAEDAGALSRVGIEPMPATLPAGNLHLIVRRRLEQVPRPARPLLEAAAVIGRRLDPALLRRLDPAADVEAWIRACADVAVLDVSEGGWRFAHDKLREGVIATLAAPARRELHRRVAQAIEDEHAGGAPEHAMALAHHWAQAGDVEKEARYSALAGEQALQSSAYADAAAFFERAIAIVSASERGGRREASLFSRALSAVEPALPLGRGAVSAGSARFLLGRWEGRLSETYGRMSEHAEAIRHGARALAHLGLPMPRGRAGLVAALPVQAGRRALISLSPREITAASDDARAVLLEATRIHTRIAESCFYTQEALPLLFSGLAALNLGEPAGPSAHLARGYAMMVAVAGIVPLHTMARAWSRRALDLVEQVGKPNDVAFVLQRVSAYRLWMGEWEEAEAAFERVSDLAERLGDRRAHGDALSCLVFSAFYRGEMDRLLARLDEADAWLARTADQVVALGAPILRASALLRRGDPARAVELCRQVQPAIDATSTSHEVIRCHGALALALQRADDVRGARGALDHALRLLGDTRPVAFWTLDGVTAAAEAALSLWESSGSPEDEPRALRAVAASRAYASVFPIGKPFALLWDGLLARLSGRPIRARVAWERCLAESDRMRMPYERARALLEMGRHLRRGDAERRHLLTRAEALLGDLGAHHDRRRALAELDR